MGQDEEFLKQIFFFFFFKQKTTYEIMPSRVGSEMCIKDRMTHLRRHHKVSISMLNECFVKPGHVLDMVESGLNTSYILTKAGGPGVHLRQCIGLGLDLKYCLLYTSDAADDPPYVGCGCWRILKN